MLNEQKPLSNREGLSVYRFALFLYDMLRPLIRPGNEEQRRRHSCTGIWLNEQKPLSNREGLSVYRFALFLYDMLRPLIRPTMSPMDDLNSQSAESSPVNAMAIQIKIAKPIKNSNIETPRANLYETARSLPI